MVLETLRNLPLSVSANFLDRSKGTLVFDLPTSEFVLKMDLSVRQKFPVPPVGRVATFIENQIKKEGVALKAVPSGVLAPPEHHFIAADNDGIPTAFRIQKRVRGTRLSDVELRTLSVDQKKALAQLFWNGFKFNVRDGVNLDLVGTTPNTSHGKRVNLMRCLNPLANSVNILLTEDGVIAWVDVKSKPIPTTYKDSKARILKAAGYLKDFFILQKEIFKESLSTRMNHLPSLTNF